MNSTSLPPPPPVPPRQIKSEDKTTPPFALVKQSNSCSLDNNKGLPIYMIN